MDHTALRAGFRQARQTPRSRHRDIAEALGVSEGELIAAHAGAFDRGESPLQATRLVGDWPRLVADLEALGELMALTRNPSCVHEKTGVYRGSSTDAEGRIGLVLGGDIDLRLFYHRWAHGFAVDEALADGGRQRSLQFFDAAGQAVHKVFLRPASDAAAYAALVQRHAAPGTRAGIVIEATAPRTADAADADIDVAALRADWAALQDTHEFFGLLKRHGVSRTQALRLAEARFAQPLPTAVARELLQRAAQQAVSLMVFVGNPGAIQIHSGPVQRVEVMGPWLNVLDPGFNLHLREDHIVRAWRVAKPTRDGLVHSLELFSADGETIAMFFGERKPGKPEREDWRELLASLGSEAAACAP